MRNRRPLHLLLISLLLIDLLFSQTITSPISPGGGGAVYFGGTIVPPVSANWSSIGSSCTVTGNGTGPSGATALRVVGAVGVISTCGFQITAPAGNFTRTFVLYAAAAGVNNSEIGVGFTDGTKAEYCAVSWGGVFVINSISETTLGGVGLAAANGDAGLNLMASSGPIFFQLSRTGTALQCSYSPDGQNYTSVFLDNTSPFLTASSLIFVVDPRNAAKSSTAYLISYQ